MWKLIFVASLLALADGAALVRFINTVPTRTSNPSVNAAGTAASVTGRLTGKPVSSPGAAVAAPSYNLISDRIGLHYYPSATSSPSVVWTTLLEANEVETTSAPYYWYHAMPALRGYHGVATGAAAATETAAVDKPLGTLVKDDNFIGTSAATTPAGKQEPNLWDIYDQTRLRADGVGLYLSFAPGQYRFEAYGVISTLATAGGAGPAATAPVFNQIPNKFTSSANTFTFEENKVYTLIAYGNAAFDATLPYTGADVKLTLLTEDITTTTFGKASLRFFHGIQRESANAIDIYQGDIDTVGKKIVSSISFGSVSSYIDVAPANELELPVGVPGTNVRPVATGIPVKREVRPGSRLTVICAHNNLDTDTTTNNPVFCRGIPSRAVAYVRLVNDVTSQKSVVQGKFFPQKLSETPLTLWASYEVPRTELVTEQSQVIANSVFTNHPATTEGLYPVVSNVAAGKVSGYGEVFVPIPIMDFAIRWIIGAMHDIAFTSASGVVTNKVIGGSSANPFGDASATLVPKTHFWLAPVLKRVHFVLKTDGGATLTGLSGDKRILSPFVFPSTATRGFEAPAAFVDPLTPATYKSIIPAFSLTVDEYIEPGQYYTIFAYPAKQYSNTANAATMVNRFKNTLTTVTAYQDPAILRVAIRLDHTMASTGIQTAISSAKGLVAFVPFFHREVYDGAAVTVTKQDFSTGAVSFKQGSTEVLAITAANMAATYGKNLAVVMRSVVGNTLADGVDSADGSGTLAATDALTVNGDTAYSAVSVGTSTLSYTLAGSNCYTTVPSGQSITIASQTITDLFVLNAYGCLEAGSDTSLLSLVPVVRASAATTGHSPFVKRSIDMEASVPFYNSASVTHSSIFCALAALFLALFAF